MNDLIVSEVFGPTYQGEGPSCGQVAMFLRLGGCNLTCAGCDTPYTWRWSRKLPHRLDDVYQPKLELTSMHYIEVADRLEDIGAPLLVITGGEPMLQADRLRPLLSYLSVTQPQLRVEIETNGTIPVDAYFAMYIDQFNVSPKLSHWENDPHKAYVPDVIEAFRTFHPTKAIFKFVCHTASDVEEAERMVHDHKIDHRSVWIMPEGRSSLELYCSMTAIRDVSLGYGFNLTTRLHVLLWGDQRGV